MAHIELDDEIRRLKKEFMERMEFLEGRLKYLEELITSLARDADG
jgi:hypothetical protein